MGKENLGKGRYFLPANWLGMEFILGVGYHVQRGHVSLTEHRHGGWELTYLESGEVVWETEGGDKLRLRGGDFGITQPEVAHAGELQIIRPCVLFWMIFTIPDTSGGKWHGLFSPTTVEAMAKSLRQAGNRVFSAPPSLREAVRELREDMTGDSSLGLSPEPLREAWSRTLAARVVLAAAAGACQGESTAADQAGGLSVTAEKFMAANLYRNIGVADIAAAIGLSSAKFSGRFKREVGMPPADYLRRLRLARAVELMGDRGLSITDIAFRIGFSSSQHFASVFRQYHGVSPGQYRQSVGGEGHNLKIKLITGKDGHV